jgi:hypothetical protein
VSAQPPASGSQTANDAVGTVQRGGAGAQTANDSAGTVQTQLPGSNGAVVASRRRNDGGVNPSGSVSVSVLRGQGGAQQVGDSLGTVQVGSGPQTVHDSIGTVQAGQPGVDVEVEFMGPLRPDMPDGLLTRELAAVDVAVDPADGGAQTVENSVGTVQIGGGGSQTATDSAVTGQIGLPSLDTSATVGGPTIAAASIDVVNGSGGSQTATGSLGTLQVGGGGPQTADDSVGTGQVATPDASGDAAVTRDLADSTATASLTPSRAQSVPSGRSRSAAVAAGAVSATPRPP